MHGILTHIGGWQKHSFIDFPGTVSAVLFYSGCNLRCPFCHNPALALGTVANPPDPDEIITYLQKRRGLIEGVVLSGGEPTIHPSIFELTNELRALKYQIKLDTNGLLPDVIERIAPDYLALDVKTRPDLYAAAAGSSYPDTRERLIRSIDIVRKMGKRAEIRITMSPICADDQSLSEISELIQGVEIVYLQEMAQRVPLLDPSYTSVALPPIEQLHRFQLMLKQVVGACHIRGKD